ncbi:MAG: YppF family protein [Bacilli bacterium]
MVFEEICALYAKEKDGSTTDANTLLDWMTANYINEKIDIVTYKRALAVLSKENAEKPIY